MSDIQIVQFDKITGIARLALTNSPKTLDGMDKLVQIVVLGFLRNPGRDVIDPGEGSGFRQAIGQYNFTEDTEVKLLAVQRTTVVEQEILSRQEVGNGVPTERLKSLKILDVGVDSSTFSAFLNVQIINEAGDTTNILV